MVHLLALYGTASAVNRALNLVQKHANGTIELKPQVWLFGSNLTAATWRDYLGANVEGIELLVVAIDGGWAMRGQLDIARWLQQAEKHSVL